MTNAKVVVKVGIIFKLRKELALCRRFVGNTTPGGGGGFLGRISKIVQKKPPSGQVPPVPGGNSGNGNGNGSGSGSVPGQGPIPGSGPIFGHNLGSSVAQESESQKKWNDMGLISKNIIVKNNELIKVNNNVIQPQVPDNPGVALVPVIFNNNTASTGVAESQLEQENRTIEMKLNREKALAIYDHFKSRGRHLSDAFHDSMDHPDSHFSKGYPEVRTGVIEDRTKGAILKPPFDDPKSLEVHPSASSDDFEKQARAVVQLTSKKPYVYYTTPSGEQGVVNIVKLSDIRLDGSKGDQNVVAMKILSKDDSITEKDDQRFFKTKLSKKLAKNALLEASRKRTHEVVDKQTGEIKKKEGTIVTKIDKDNTGSSNTFKQTTDIE